MWGDHNNHNAFKYKYSDWEILSFLSYIFSAFTFVLWSKRMFCLCIVLYWASSYCCFGASECFVCALYCCIGHQAAPDIPNIPLVPIHSAVQYLFLSAVIVYFSPTILLFQFIFTQPGKWKGRDRDAKENMHQI